MGGDEKKCSEYDLGVVVPMKYDQQMADVQGTARVIAAPPPPAEQADVPQHVKAMADL